jgi:3-hexulose-6-phosphate synthase
MRSAVPGGLQLALDGTLEQALVVLEQVHDLVERIEVGTPLVFREGMRAVRAVRERWPRHHLLADLKIMDAGAEEARIAFEAGADEVSVLSLAADATIAQVVAAARSSGRAVLADLIEAREPVARARRLHSAGVDVLAVHVGVDEQGRRTPFEAFAALREALPDARLAIAGGIDARSAARLREAADIVVVGGGIARADDPRAAALALREALGLP